MLHLWHATGDDQPGLKPLHQNLHQLRLLPVKASGRGAMGHIIDAKGQNYHVKLLFRQSLQPQDGIAGLVSRGGFKAPVDLKLRRQLRGQPTAQPLSLSAHANACSRTVSCDQHPKSRPVSQHPVTRTGGFR
jgi:hypothetical protein